MIRINRASVPIPHAFETRRLVAERRRALEFFALAPRERPAPGFDFEPKLWEAARDDLRRLFRGKCAYCETRLADRKAWRIDHFRPLRRARQLDGRTTRDAYGWLAYEWANLYPCCPTCHRNKSARFPVDGERASPRDPDHTPDRERALLLDPCVDDPETYLSFTPRGVIQPSKRARASPTLLARARATIETLKLNRGELVEGRWQAMQEAQRACREVTKRANRLVAGTGASMSHPAARVARKLLPWMPFSAARRWAARKALERLGGFGQQIIGLVPALASASGAKRAVKPTTRRRRAVYMKQLVIENFRAIRQVSLDFDGGSDAGAASWKVVLGENGTGKSALLQATALALGGEHTLQQALINWSKWLRRPRGKRAGPREGFVRVILDNGERIELRFDKDHAWFTSGADGALSFLRGYGATRNLPNTQAPASWGAVRSLVRTISLFDAASRFVTAEGWLTGLSDERFAAVAPALKDLMQLRESDRIRRVPMRDPDTRRSLKTPVVDIGNSTVRLDELSDGYQSVVALACDIMAGLPDATDMRNEIGIVLIDELGNHLHPSWRMRVVKSLKTAFPRMQFLVTTHEPLCLRGLDNHEVVVLKKDADREVRLLSDLPPIKGLLVDQILSSPHFGLRSTIDPEFADLLDEYYELLAEDQPSPDARARLAALAPLMNRLRLIGETPREQILLRTIDEYLARADAAVQAIDPAQLPDDLQRRLLEVLAAAEPTLDDPATAGRPH